MPIQEDPPAGAPEWVVTYGDMMSLLLTFFIMLVSMSQLKEEGSMRAMLNAIKEAFGAEDAAFGSPGPSRQKTSVLDKLSSLGIQSRGGVKRSNPNSPGAGGSHHPVMSLAKGPVLSLGGPGLFTRFEAHMTPELEKQLQSILEVVRNRPNHIEIRGHCSPEPLPLDSPYRDWVDLSFARAHLVAMYLIEHGIEANRVLITAAGETEPVHISVDGERRALNDRVDVFLKDSYITAPTSSESGD